MEQSLATKQHKLPSPNLTPIIGVAVVIALAITTIPLLDSVRHTTNDLRIDIQASHHFQTIRYACLFVLTMIWGLVTYTIIHLRKNKIRLSFFNEKQEKYQDFFSDIIVQDYQQGFEVANKTSTSLQMEDVALDENRELLLHELKEMYINIAGCEKSRLRDIYLACGFAEDLKDKIESKKWDVRKLALEEISAFELTAHYSKIKTLLDDDHQTVRHSALKFYSAKSANPISVLAHLTSPLSLKEKHIITEEAKKRKDKVAYDFPALIADHPSHAKFIRKLSRIINHELKAKRAAISKKENKKKRPESIKHKKLQLSKNGLKLVSNRKSDYQKLLKELQDINNANTDKQITARRTYKLM